MKIVVCDDEAVFRNTLIKHISTYKDAKYEVVAYSSGEEVLRHIDEKDIYAYILDIELGGMNGIELAKQIRKKDLFVPIIYTTSYTSFAMDAFEVTAFRYLNKPITKDVLHKTLGKLDEYMGLNNKKYVIQHKGVVTSLNYRDIIYMDVQLRTIRIHTVDGIYTNNIPLKEMENGLDKELFIKVAKSTIVNKDHVRTINKRDILMDNGDIVYMTRSYGKGFKEEYMEFVLKMSE